MKREDIVNLSKGDKIYFCGVEKIVDKIFINEIKFKDTGTMNWTAIYRFCSKHPNRALNKYGR